MRAVVLNEHGGLDKMTYVEDFPDPVPEEGDVVIRVKASSNNYHDIFTRRGMPGIKIPMPLIVGLDIAGEVVEVGPGVRGGRLVTCGATAGFDPVEDGKLVIAP
ncbi:alcohol dehydrogenase catalytic domain-containing protein [Hoeflea sp. CAU 1731]